MKFVHKVAVLLAMAIVSLAFSSASTSVATGDPTLVATQHAVNPSASATTMGAAMCSRESVNETGDAYLPLNRWGNVSSFHTRLDSGALGVGNLANRLQKQGVATMFLSAGNIMWQTAAGAVTLADRFCIGDETFRSVDKMAGAIGRAMFQEDKNTPSLVGVAVFSSLVMALWAISRGQDGKKKVTTMLIGVSFLTMMVWGGAKTTDSQFGFGSPGYLAKAMNTVVGTVAAAPAMALNDSVDTIKEPGVPKDSGGEHCYYYIKELEKEYRDGYSKKAYDMPGFSTNAPKTLKSNAVVPLSLNSMWKATGLAVFTDAQFGTRNSFGEKMNCRYLEVASGIPVEYGKVAGKDVNIFGQLSITKNISGGNGGAWKPTQSPWNLTSAERLDAAMVGWAACKVGGNPAEAKVEPLWAAAEGRDSANKHEKLDNGACTRFLTQENDDGFGKGNYPFDFDTDHKDLSDTATPEVRDFMVNWHGTGNTAAIGVMMLYSVVSLIIVVVFVTLALAVVGAKIGLLVMTLMMILVAVIAIFPSDSANNRIAQVFKQYIGMAVLAFGASLLISMVAAITAIIQNLGADTSLVKDSAVLSIFWAGVSPAVSLFLVKHIFEKVLKAPSPFKPTSAMGFAQAAAGGAVGGAVGGGMVGRQMRRMRYNAESEMMDHIRGRGRGGATMRRRGDQPDARTSGFDVNTTSSSAARSSGGQPTGNLDAQLSSMRGQMQTDPDVETPELSGENLYAVRNDPNASAAAKAKEERMHGYAAQDFAAQQRSEARKAKLDSVKSSVGAKAKAVQSSAEESSQAVKSDDTKWYNRKDGAVAKVARNGMVVGHMASKQAGALASKVSQSTTDSAKAAAKKMRDFKAMSGREKFAAMGRGVKATARKTREGAYSVRNGVRASGQFVQRHKTAITAATLGVATVATAGIATPLAAGYAAKKGVGAAKRAVVGDPQRRAEDIRAFNDHQLAKAQQEVDGHNEAVEEARAARAEKKTEEEVKRRADAQQLQEAAKQGQDVLPINLNERASLADARKPKPTDEDNPDHPPLWKE